jgi:hypothetical protein
MAALSQEALKELEKFKPLIAKMVAELSELETTASAATKEAEVVDKAAEQK